MADLNKIIELRRKGLSYRQIGKLLKISGQRVHTILKNKGIEKGNIVRQIIKGGIR